MTDALRPRRSVLYMPGANERALEKAKTLAADALILDLEDAVAPDAKADARDRVCAAANSGEYGHREITIRANGLGTPWHADDVTAIAAAAPDGIVIPKVNSLAEVRLVADALEKAGAPDRTKIWAMLETPQAVMAAHEIASHDRLAVLVMGTNDLVKELQAEFVAGRAPIMTALSQCVIGARIAGKVILDGVFNDLDDADGFAAECLQGRQLGMDGKTLIHPKQLGPANDAWAPTDEAVAHAEEVIAAFEAARAQGLGVATVNGRLIENLHVEQAERTVAQARAIATLGD